MDSFLSTHLLLQVTYTMHVDLSSVNQWPQLIKKPPKQAKAWRNKDTLRLLFVMGGIHHHLYSICGSTQSMSVIWCLENEAPQTEEAKRPNA